MERKASAVWLGGLKEGKGAVSTASGVLSEAPYSFLTRFEQRVGTNPEELLAAAHASCFAMALSFELGKVGITPRKLEAAATVTIDMVQDQFVITKSHIDLVAHIPHAEKMAFEAAVRAAQVGCPVSKLFKAEITVSAKLVS